MGIETGGGDREGENSKDTAVSPSLLQGHCSSGNKMLCDPIGLQNYLSLSFLIASPRLSLGRSRCYHWHQLR